VSNLAVALLLLIALIARPRGLTGGRELPWVTQWRLPGRGRATRGEPRRPAVAAETELPAPPLPAEGQVQTPAGSAE
jgi:hypothetical protein